MKKISYMLLIALAFGLCSFSKTAFADGVGSSAEFVNAINNPSVNEISIENDFVCNETVTVTRDIVIQGNGHTIEGVTINVVSSSSFALSSVVLQSSASNSIIVRDSTNVILSDVEIRDNPGFGMKVFSSEGKTSVVALTGNYSSSGNNGGAIELIGDSRMTLNNLTGLYISDWVTNQDLKTLVEASAEEGKQSPYINPLGQMCVVFRTDEGRIIYNNENIRLNNYVSGNLTYYLSAYDDTHPNVDTLGLADSVVLGQYIDFSVITFSDDVSDSDKITVEIFAEGPDGLSKSLTGITAQFPKGSKLLGELTGTYCITIVAGDAYANETKRYKRIDVVKTDCKPPVISSATFNRVYTVGSEIATPDFRAVDGVDGYVDCDLKLTSPDGSESSVGDTIYFDVRGVYVLSVTATDVSGNVGTSKYYLSVVEPAEISGYVEETVTPAYIFVLIGVGVIVVSSVIINLIMIRKR
ncbi:MAG: pectate lyase-like adhesive domain-containing protein [Christensenellales bacterium]